MVPLRPILEYGNVVWARCLRKNITCTENVNWHLNKHIIGSGINCLEYEKFSFTRDIFTLVSRWWFIKKTIALRVYKLCCCHFFSPTTFRFNHWNDRLELVRITTAENKVSCHKDTVENWSPATRIQCLLVSNIWNLYFHQTMQPSSNSNSCNPFISHQYIKLEKQ